MRTWVKKLKTHKIDLYALGDFHLGSRNCAEKSIEKAVEIIRKNKNARFILTGDLAEFVPPAGDKRYDIENIAEEYRSNPIEKQLIRLKELLSPIKDKCIGYVDGNHESVLSRKVGYNIARSFARDVLGTEYLGFASLTKLKFKGGKTVDIFITHGTGSAKTLRGRKKSLWKLRNIAKADLYMQGHLHDLIVTDDIERRENANENVSGVLINKDAKIAWLKPERKPYYVMTSSFYRTYTEGTTSYAERAGYPPLKIGMVEIKLKDGEILSAKEIHLD